MHSPRRVSHPSKDSPRPQPHHVTVAVAPLPFPPAFLGPSHRLRCQIRCSRLRRTGASASRLCSAVESVAPYQPLPAGGALSFHGLRSPPRSFQRPEDNPCPRIPHHLQSPLRRTTWGGGSVPHLLGSRFAGRSERLLAEGDPGGMAASSASEDTVVDHLAPDIGAVRRPLRPGSIAATEAARCLAPGPCITRGCCDGGMTRCGRNPFVGSPRVEASPCSPGPDRSQDPGVDPGRSLSRAVPMKSVRS